MDEIGSNACTRPAHVLEKRARPQEQLNCPRCNSTNTKFCYYNNYSLTQPRYFCKTCRRYWTEGGTLRNVPVGGGSRKNKKPIPLASSASSKISDLNPLSLSQFSSQTHRPHQGQDLNLSFPGMDKYYGATQYVEVPKSENETGGPHQQNHGCAASTMELLRSSSSGIASRGLNSFMVSSTPMQDSNTLNMYPSAGFYLQDVKPNVGFCVEGSLGSSRYGIQENNNIGGRILFPFGELKQVSTTTTSHEVDHHQNKAEQGNSTAYWNGISWFISWSLIAVVEN
ncbi:hypothetical protein FNV43_RR18110 [Rhamnella rubrinervis]|uniref:Dof zinc finger protein n=1 Tax=Rhamnella rubrinervis TaxID=2594499 RepID=A0A8K0DYE6_9ROSA|nr:hypothetical protein FNV43_RR18110 [Rhamnella rubrinervis]